MEGERSVSTTAVSWWRCYAVSAGFPLRGFLTLLVSALARQGGKAAFAHLQTPGARRQLVSARVGVFCLPFGIGACSLYFAPRQLETWFNSGRISVFLRGFLGAGTQGWEQRSCGRCAGAGCHHCCPVEPMLLGRLCGRAQCPKPAPSWRRSLRMHWLVAVTILMSAFKIIKSNFYAKKAKWPKAFVVCPSRSPARVCDVCWPHPGSQKWKFKLPNMKL